MKRFILLLSLLIGNVCYSAAIVQYKLNDNTDTDVALDSVGSHNGTISDAGGTATSVAHHHPGHIGGGAFEFDGTDDHIIISDHADFTFSGAFSISVWIEADSVNGFPIASKYSSGNEEWQLWLDGSGYLSFAIFDASESAYIGRYCNICQAGIEGIFAHIVAVYNGDIFSNGCRLYVNNVQVDDSDLSANLFAAIENKDADVTIGYGHDNLASPFADYADGRIDNLIIYDGELNNSQINGLYNDWAGTEDVSLSSYAGSSMRIRYSNGYRYRYRNRYNFE